MKRDESGRYRRRGDVVVEGNATIEQNLYVDGGGSIDGKLEVAGNAHVGKNLKVDGFLDAPNIRGCSKGLFKSRESLIAAYPRPHKGWWAVVCSDLSASSSEGLLYVCGVDEYERLYWDDTGETCNLDGLINQFSQYDEDIDDINKRLDAIDVDVTSTDDYIKTLAKAIDSLGETVESTIQDVSVFGVSPLSLYAATTDIVEDDKVVGKRVSITGEVAEATETLPGAMSAKDKALVEALKGNVAYFDSIVDDVILTTAGVAPSVSAIIYSTSANAFVARCVRVGITSYYAQWEAPDTGVYEASDAYMNGGVPYSKLYISGNAVYVYDIYLQTLVPLGDTSAYDEDRRKLGFAYGSLASGRVNNGTERFNGVYDSSETTCVFYDDAGEEYDGIVWLCDKKMFVAYKAAAVSGNGCTEAVWFFFYHWATDYLYMENVGEEGGLWKDKLYIGVGHVWMWKTCSKNLELAGASGDYELITNEEIDEIFADFNIVAPVEVTGLTSVELRVDEPLVAAAPEYDGTGGVILPLSLAEATEEEVDNIFGINE